AFFEADGQVVWDRACGVDRLDETLVEPVGPVAWPQRETASALEGGQPSPGMMLSSQIQRVRNHVPDMFAMFLPRSQPLALGRKNTPDPDPGAAARARPRPVPAP
ncbi:hypothetical protein ABT363_41060, partial [Streptomyces sp. NPDC000188]